MGWYTVIKTINKHRYVYRQRTWRENGKVKCQSVYIGKAGGDERAPKQSNVTAPTSRVMFHGARQEFNGAPRGSTSGRYGAGLYLTTKEGDAELFSKYSPKSARYILAGEDVGKPEFNGKVYRFDVAKLKIMKFGGHDEYLDMQNEFMEANSGKRKFQEDFQKDLQKRLIEQGYEGMEIAGEETVVFPKFTDKLDLPDEKKTKALKPKEVKPKKNRKPRKLPRKDYYDPKAQPMEGGLDPRAFESVELTRARQQSGKWSAITTHYAQEAREAKWYSKERDDLRRKMKWANKRKRKAKLEVVRSKIVDVWQKM